MKKIILIAIVFIIFISGCDTAQVDKNSEVSHRIIGKEYNVYDGTGYQIIEVDGVEYLSKTSGGICPLVDTTKH